MTAWRLWAPTETLLMVNAPVELVAGEIGPPSGSICAVAPEWLLRLCRRMVPVTVPGRGAETVIEPFVFEAGPIEKPLSSENNVCGAGGEVRKSIAATPGAVAVNSRVASTNPDPVFGSVGASWLNWKLIWLPGWLVATLTSGLRPGPRMMLLRFSLELSYWRYA